jgi:hypothetical protein
MPALATREAGANQRDAVMTPGPDFGKRSWGDPTPSTVAQADGRAKALPGGGICPSLLTRIIFC